MSILGGFIEKFDDDQVIIAKADRSIDWVPRSQIPEQAHEGDFICQDQENGPFRIDMKITEERRREIRRLMDNLFD